ncbi:MAG: Gfo/Idh/MocA family oxidoreductase [bacterium]|nr:Gfo/Idh/MocA family oxidoreductase [bacterium]
MGSRSHSKALDRRRFVTQSAAQVAAVGYFTSTARSEVVTANGKLNVACIGTAHRAAADIAGVGHESIVALCDVDSRYLNAKLVEFPDAKPFDDYRAMLDQMGDQIDAVVVGTTDHHHAPASLRAIQAGKHVYCEKPLTHTVQEARILTEAARKAGVATQMGTQIHAGDNYRRVVEVIRSGALGEISDVHVWVGKGWGGGERPQKAETPPPHLNWDLWLGPAPERPYASERYHPAEWRRWWDFGQGTLGDMGCHYIDLPFWALDLKYPVYVEAEGPPVHAETAPLGMKAKFKFPANQLHSGLNLTWYDGNMIPTRINGVEVKRNGVIFIGSEGMMFADYGSYELFPESKFAAFEPPPKSIPDSIGHHLEWLKACRDDSPTTCNFDDSGPLTETVLLGNVAYRSGVAFHWNGPELEADNEAAQKLLSKEYRKGWEVEAS